MKKKQVEMVNYQKGTEATNLDEVINIINKSDDVFILQQVVYDDKSQSVTIQVHFKPFKNDTDTDTT
jgi:uncharacterized membrane protein